MLITGGLPPVGRPIDDVYRATYARMLERTARYLARYPGDLERLREPRPSQLDGRATCGCPYGDRLTSRRLRRARQRCSG